MGKKKQWNISKNKCNQLLLNTIQDIIKNQDENNVFISDLQLLIQEYPNLPTLTKNNCRKTMIQYINENYGSLEQYLTKIKSDIEVVPVDKHTKMIRMKELDRNFVKEGWILL